MTSAKREPRTKSKSTTPPAIAVCCRRRLRQIRVRRDPRPAPANRALASAAVAPDPSSAPRRDCLTLVALCITHPRIEPSIADVDEQVDQDVDGRHEEGPALDDVEIF